MKGLILEVLIKQC